ncbi:hypothetical protein, partial [Chamaesiphon sp. OTE_75_metabat_556]|uniref:hypothetical protein n=1 Tax=Chamaesiphon sp. OTE_75_metabat_556 TaxID=2964692 RepID=UPI00286A8FEE
RHKLAAQFWFIRCNGKSLWAYRVGAIHELPLLVRHSRQIISTQPPPSSFFAPDRRDMIGGTVGSHLLTAQMLLTLIPIAKTTKDSSIWALNLPGTTLDIFDSSLLML